VTRAPTPITTELGTWHNRPSGYDTEKLGYLSRFRSLHSAAIFYGNLTTRSLVQKVWCDSIRTSNHISLKVQYQVKGKN
jgi:hypothetical protein